MAKLKPGKGRLAKKGEKMSDGFIALIGRKKYGKKRSIRKGKK